MDEKFRQDIDCMIARLTQMKEEPEMVDFLWWRIFTCDIPRVNRHVADGVLRRIGR